MKRRITISLAVIALVGSALAILPVKSKSPREPEPANVQPLTYSNVVSHFRAAHLRATEVQKRCTIFFEGEWTSRDVYNYGLIIVENSDEDVQVTFYLTDAHEMNWVTEFIDAPFFTHPETQALFGLMNSGRRERPTDWSFSPGRLSSLEAAPRRHLRLQFHALAARTINRFRAGKFSLLSRACARISHGWASEVYKTARHRRSRVKAECALVLRRSNVNAG